MSINSIESAVKYAGELDKLFTHKSATGFFADNAFGKKFVGAKTVIIPDVDFQGLANYDRENGFSRSAITVANTPYTMTMDRARSLQIDREDMDESGIAALAGKVLGEYVRRKVVPECDAYVLSKLAQIAVSRGNILKVTDKNPFGALADLINSVRGVVGFNEELVAFVNSSVYAALQKSSEVSRMLIPSNFKQGEINMTVNSFNGVSIIPVVNSLMKLEYEFNNDEAGGFTPTQDRETLIIVCPKSAAHLVKKTENMRVFTPEQNTGADAYKFDYRIYYDVFVKKSELDTIWAAVSPDLSIYIDAFDKEKNISVGDSVSVPVSINNSYIDGMYFEFQWYYSENADLSSPVKIDGATGQDLLSGYVDTNEAFNRYYFVRICVNGLNYVNSEPIHIICK